MAFLDFFLDAVFIILLVAVLLYVFKLNKHIHILQDSKDELRNLLGQFVSSTERAEQALQRIKAKSRDATMTIDEAIAEARSLKLELTDLIRRSEIAASNVSLSLDRTPVSPKPTEIKDEFDLDKGVEERLSKLIETVEAGEANFDSVENIDRNAENTDNNEKLARDETTSTGSDAKAKSKEELMKALRGQ